MSGGRRRGFPGSIAVAALCVSIAGCGPTAVQRPAAPPPKIPWTATLADVRAVWSADPGIDLLTAPAVVVRAYLESIFVAANQGDIGYAYPGFTHAVAPNASAGQPDSARDRWPDTAHPLRDRLVGTDRYHILHIDTAGPQVTAVVCDWAYTSALDLGDGNYGWKATLPATDPAARIAVHRVAMTAPAGSPTSSLPPQQGTAAAPVDDVFGGWHIVGHDMTADRVPGTNTDSAQWPAEVTDTASCVDKAPDPVGRRLFLLNGVHPRSEFPTQPPYPGWPAGGVS
jgi:hypothetical protein